MKARGERSNVFIGVSGESRTEIKQLRGFYLNIQAGSTLPGFIAGNNIILNGCQLGSINAIGKYNLELQIDYDHQIELNIETVIDTKSVGGASPAGGNINFYSIQKV